MSVAWKSGMFQALSISVSCTAGQCDPFSLFLNSHVDYRVSFSLDRIQPTKGNRRYKLHSQSTKTRSKSYKLHEDIATAIPNQALQRHRWEQLAWEQERHGVVVSSELRRMNFTSPVPLHSYYTEPKYSGFMWVQRIEFHLESQKYK